MNEKEKLESLYASLPGELKSPGVILAVIEVLLALKKLYDLLHRDKAKLFADAPTTAEPLCWTVLGGEKQEEKEEE